MSQLMWILQLLFYLAVNKKMLFWVNLALWQPILVGIVVDMLQHVVTACHLLPISGRHGWHANLVTEWVMGVTCQELSCVVYDTTRWRSLLFVFVACCDATKKDVDVTSHPSCWRHVTKCHISLMLSPSILLWQQTTIPTKQQMKPTPPKNMRYVAVT